MNQPQVRRSVVIRSLAALSVVFLGIAAHPLPLRADMGAVHVAGTGVNLTEPAQKALVLFNGVEEILILETDMTAARDTGVLRFLPLPAEPAIAAAPPDAFDATAALVRDKGLKYLSVFHSKGGPAEAQSAPVVETVSHRKIGAHDLTVVKINDVSRFKEWTRAYFERNRLGGIGESAAVEAMVADYVRRGIDWFVFDFVTVTPAETSVQALAYRFRTGRIYYPLRTSNSVGGEGGVRILFLAPNRLCSPLISAYALEDLQYAMNDDRPAGIDHFRFSTYAPLTPDEAATIHPDSQEFFDGSPIVLQCAAYDGRLSFKEDLFLPMPEQFDPAGELLPGGDFSLAAPKPGMLSLDDILPQGHSPKSPGETTIEEFERAEYDHRTIVGSVLNGDLYIVPLGRLVRFADGVWEDGGDRMEIRKLAVGALDDDAAPDVAVILEGVVGGKPVCELGLLTGLRSENRVLTAMPMETGRAAVMDSCDARSLSVTDHTVRITFPNDRTARYALRGGRLAAVRE